ncbi:protein involved in polysaccharide export [Thioploca ingrica]|uniref:Protein involved in polysaccharide export n=1 Tax=Thioploca ingrica TaxID=40754 RepID=A0A090BUH1_9GAMM|nr:protein involved in polysaccharide export [Thioploca ingrica]
MKQIINLSFITTIYLLITGCVTLDIFDDADFSPYPKLSAIAKQPQAQIYQPRFADKSPIKLREKELTVILPDQDKSPIQPQSLPEKELPAEPVQPKPEPIELVAQLECQAENSALMIAQQEILSNYRLGAGDLISIKVFGEEDFSITSHLSETGTISYPFLGELALAGLTIKDMEDIIITGLKGGYLVNPKVTVTVLEYRKVFVNGEVKNPGGYAFVPGLTVNKVISLAGGLTEMADDEMFFIIRNGNKSSVPLCANLKTYIRPGDIILIKQYQKFFVDGEVKNPGSYAFKPGLTVKKAISLAGGFSDKASPEDISLVHEGQESAMSSPITLDMRIRPGDIITVKEYKKVFVNGEVQKPGGYAFEPGLTVEKAIALAGGFTEFASAQWSKIFILREGYETTIPTSVKLNTTIRPGDIVTVKESWF